MGFPRQLKIFTAFFQNIGDPDEELTVQWADGSVPPLGLNPGNGTAHFTVGSDVFLESPSNVSQCPDEQLLASLSMAAILAGEILPGTSEFIAAVTGQGTKYFQTIIGNATLKSVARVSDPSIGPEGSVYDVEFQKVGQASNVKTVRADAWAISQYSNRLNNPSHAIHCVPGAIYKQFPGLKKSQLGSEESQTRTDIIDFIQNQYFWI